MTLAYTLVNVGSSVSQATTTSCVVTVLHVGAPGETVTVIVTSPGVEGQVKIGVALDASSNVPAVAVQAKVGVSEPTEAVADSAIGLLTDVSSGEALTESRLAQTWVDPFTTTVPTPGGVVEQLRVRSTEVMAPVVTSKVAEPVQVKAPSTDTADSVIR